MTYSQIRELPTTIDTGPNSGRIHESTLRSHAMLIKVQQLCEQKCPNEVIWDIIEDFRTWPQKDRPLQS
jgi:hypothetical protein